MQVFLIRHADAVDETLELRDPARHLTALGRTQARALGERMRWHDCIPTHVWTSPLVRALQTAELVAASLHSAALVEVVPALAPDGSPRDVVAAVRALPHDAGVMVVGHEPAISAIGALLVQDPAFEALTKAQAVRILDGVVRWRFAWDDEAAAPAR
ncbi:MAG: histidine phosphatase family protein [Kofleriaceae bacterium]